MVKSDPAINSCASSNYTYQLPSNNFTYSYTEHANFNYDISTMDLHINGTKQRTHNTRAPFIQYFAAWSAFKIPLIMGKSIR